MTDTQKPDGYYDEIEYTWNKAGFLLEHFKEYSPSIHTNADSDFEYLEENECAMIIKNPYCENDIEFEMAGEFSLFFAGWHSHYFTYEYAFSEMVHDAESIITNKCCAVVVKRGDDWVASFFLEDNETISAEKIKGRFASSDNLPEERRHEIDFSGCTAYVHFWDNCRDYDIALGE